MCCATTSTVIEVKPSKNVKPWVAMHSVNDTAGANQNEGAFQPTDADLWDFLKKHGLAAAELYNAIKAQSLNLQDLRGISEDDLAELCNGLKLLLGQKIKLKKAIRELSVTEEMQSKDSSKSMSLPRKAIAKKSKPTHNSFISNRDPTVLPEVNIGVFGCGGVGKSAMTIRLVTGNFLDEYDPTIEDSYRKSIQSKDLPPLMWDVLDTAGQEEFQSMMTAWMRGSDVALMVYSVTHRETFNEIQPLLDKFEESGSKCKLKMLVATKVDLEDQRKVSQSEGYTFARDHDMLFIEISAKTEYNMDLMVHTLAAEIHQRGIARHGPRGIDLEKKLRNPGRKKMKCCSMGL